ncbi:MAG TPA: hypothetical protein VFF04_00315 [Candidatus Babeliales bacterium]|nr:hypothetical protein [Candidatus Babeliales bacterium]
MGFIVGLPLTFWTYRRTKKIDNQVAEARKALDELIEVNVALIRLFHSNDNEHHKAFTELPALFNKLRFTLLFLRHITGITDQITLINNLIEISKQDKEKSRAVADKLIEELDYDNGSSSRIDQLQKLLLSIYMVEYN